MQTILFTGLRVMGASTSPVLAFSGGGVNLDFDLSVVVQMAIFTALILVLKPLLFDPVLKIFEERERRTEGAKAEARQMQEKAGELLSKYEQELARVHRVAAEERDKMRAETAKLEREILTEARRLATETVAKGREQIARETQAIQFDLGRQSERLARDIVSRILGREVA